jgi:hypothetical protein
MDVVGGRGCGRGVAVGTGGAGGASGMRGGVSEEDSPAFSGRPSVQSEPTASSVVPSATGSLAGGSG